MISAGWGKLLFFDVGEHSTNDAPSKKLAEIPKLGAQWRVMYDFKPTATAHASKFCPSFALGSWENEQVLVIEVACTSSSIILGIDRPGFETRTVASNQVPEVGQWTRIEISHEERDGERQTANKLPRPLFRPGPGRRLSTSLWCRVISSFPERNIHLAGVYLEH